MTDSNEPDELERKHERNRQERIAAIKRWAEYVKSTEPDVWGAQLNVLIESQLDAAREADVSGEQYRRVERAGEAYNEDAGTDERDE